MKQPKLLPNGKPYNIRQRLLLFACDVVDVAKKLHSRGGIARALSVQLVSAAVSAASNGEEADDGSGPRDFRAKNRICLREIKETRLRLAVFRRTGFLDQSHDALIREATELKNIVSTIIRNNEKNDQNRDKHR
jgi:four helix bundle protein